MVQYDGAAVGAAARTFLMPDERGSIAALFYNGGTLRAANTYDEYGIPVLSGAEGPGAANQGRFQYTGQAWIPELGMYHYKARIYSPTLGRFLQTDPIGYEDQVNLYAYVGNDPVNATDPEGKWGWVAVGAIINGSIQTVAEYRSGQLKSWGAVGRIATAAASGAVGGGAAGVIGRAVIGRGLAAVGRRAGANGVVGAGIGVAQAETNARISSGGARGASRSEMASAAKQGAVFGAAGSAVGDFAGNAAFRAAGGVRREAAIEASETQLMVSLQGMPGGMHINVGGRPLVPPSQKGEVVGQAGSAIVNALQSPSTPER